MTLPELREAWIASLTLAHPHARLFGITREDADDLMRRVVEACLAEAQGVRASLTDGKEYDVGADVELTGAIARLEALKEA